MRIILLIFFLLTVNAFSQNDALANEYFKNGDFEKALVEYKKLYARSPNSISTISQIVATYQQLEQYDEAEVFLLKLLDRINYPPFMIELGYNYQLKGNLELAKVYYDKALESLDENVAQVVTIARKFQEYSLLDETIQAYEKAMDIRPEYNFKLQLAQIYGEQGNIEKMLVSYVDFVQNNPIALSNIKRYINAFISDDSTSENNMLLRKILLRRMQQEPDIIFNDLLSWLFIQQKEFDKAFVQEKAIFNRNPETLRRIEELAGIAIDENQNAIAKEILMYIIDTAQDVETLLIAHSNLLQLETKTSTKENYPTIEAQYLSLFQTYGNTPQTLSLQIAYGHFLAFYMNETDKAVTSLEKTLELPITELEKAQVKLELGDILVLQEKFNKALIYYTQIQRNLKNSTISQEARFKVAKASYYKGDFDWAESQLKILKSSTSQLIANDALDLKLLISDNKYEDSLHVALKLYAKADLLAFQNRNDEAIILLDKILEEHKTDPIVAQALFKQGQLYEIKKEYNKAETNYNTIIENYRESILMDNAYFALAELYANHLALPEKAKDMYEQIIFNYQDSIYFVEARKKFRALRGDAIN
ncbi:tetratricopeptide repeat protein [Flavobacteriaceae bacterium XHP0103]|uniref:tetratricopeptide repeat protein n=1 Tax=Marixanthotalea marina TaxID=2844359 RepID=UPI002989BEBB|nr:tetratricopeptide repeat protein [Marixanthotalea marina]MBU3820531.1 tetratricopeptide repeat protein [Marixanthotalea marina]